MTIFNALRGELEKTCSTCLERKPATDVYFRTIKAPAGDRWSSCCRACDRARCRAWRKENIEKDLERNRAYYANNREARIAYKKKWRENNPDYDAEYSKRYRIENPERLAEWHEQNADKRRATRAKRRAAELQRTPPWLTKQQLAEITEFYAEAQRLTEKTGIPHEVDHILPLQGKTVSGLHVPWNMQVLTKSENVSKGNKLHY